MIWLTRKREQVLELLFPMRANCLGCGDPLGADEMFLCRSCQQRLDSMRCNQKAICLRCGRPRGGSLKKACPTCGDWPQESLDWGRFVYPYRSPIDRLIQNMKYAGVSKLTSWMADEIYALIVTNGLPMPDMVCAMPMHPRRLRKRGFNHAERIAQGVAMAMRLPLVPAVARTRNTRQQARLSGNQRKQNLHGAFAVQGDVAGKRVLLVDDVRTSGATAVSCAEALREKGASAVWLVTLAGADASTSKP